MTTPVEDLVQRIAAGDTDAEDLLVRAYETRVRTLVLVRTRDFESARDLTQEILIAALEALRKGSLRDPNKLPGFMVGVARNVVNNFFRTRDPVPLREPRDSDRLTPPQPAGDDDKRLRSVRDEIESLDPVDRQILTLTLVEGAKPRDIATRLGLSGDVVRQRKVRATRRIAVRLSQSPANAPLRNEDPSR